MRGRANEFFEAKKSQMMHSFTQSDECTCCTPGNVKKLRNPTLALRTVLNDPEKVVVIAIRWYKPGKTEAWKETYATSLNAVLIDHGEDLHDDRVAITVESAERDGEAHQMATNNAQAFARRVKAAQSVPAPEAAPAPAPAAQPSAVPSMILRIPTHAVSGVQDPNPIKKRGRPPKPR
jgi:hypothetical protein